MNKKFESNRLTDKLTRLRKQNEKALVLFLTAGFPKLESTVPLVLELAQTGADIIELGMPFSDPLADGPIIQASSQQAIKNGITLEHILGQVKEIRKHTNIPLVLMGYLNPILHYGEESFFANARKAGVDGIILPEVPLEESDRFLSLTHKHYLADILLVSPATTNKRIREIDKISSGFLYCVSTTGVTGRSNIGDIGSYLNRVKKNAKKNLVLVGFGIKTPTDAQRIVQHADGVIVGSALVQRIARGDSVKAIGGWVRQLKEAL
ncbi:MAG: tryptophan synthase subunit alpha [Bacteroidota bacterium]|jgi:tryptophan synthase alpha chain